MNGWRSWLKWLIPGIGVKRWLLLLMAGVTLISLGLALLLVDIYRETRLPPLVYLFTLRFLPWWARVAIALIAGSVAVVVAVYQINRSILAPFAGASNRPLADLVFEHHRRRHGIKVVAIGGGTGLPSVLRGLKEYTSNITAIVTVADDGGSSGRLRRELGVLPPGDFRDNIAALADDEALMTRLLKYRFADGGLEGHSFGNIFLSALSALTGSFEAGLAEASKVLAVQGRVLPSSLHSGVVLMAEVRREGSSSVIRVAGESMIPKAGGKIERVFLQPDGLMAYPEAIRAILTADLIVIGPGSLYTSILPNLLVPGIVEAIRASRAYKVYVCNIAAQPGETEGFTVEDHVLALEEHIGKGVFHAVLINEILHNHSAENVVKYVPLASERSEVWNRYELHKAPVADEEQPWRHDHKRLGQALMAMYRAVRESEGPSSPFGKRAETPG